MTDPESRPVWRMSAAEEAEWRATREPYGNPLVGSEPRAEGLDAMARDLADIVRRAPDAFCDLTGARHSDLVERRVLLAALAPEQPE